MNQIEDFETKVEQLEAQLAEEKMENERLRALQGSENPNQGQNQSLGQDLYLKEELQEAKMVLKQTTNEKNDLAKQVQDLKIELQSVRREHSVAQGQRDEV